MIFITSGGTIPCLTFGACSIYITLRQIITHLFKHGKSVFLASSLYRNGHVEGKLKIFTVNYMNFMWLSIFLLPC